MKVVCNAGPLIVLAKLGQLDLLTKLYREIIIPEEVNSEVVISGLIRGYANTNAIKILIDNKTIKIQKAQKQIENSSLGKGELETIGLALQIKANLVLIDDLQARIEARGYNLNIKGTVGIIMEARREKLLSKNDCLFLLETIRSDDDIWIADEIIDAAIKEINR